jgi:hypothetical protein
MPSAMLISEAFWQDFKFSLRHLNDFSRCALVSDGKWVTPWSEIVAPFFEGEVRYFSPDEIEAARAWLLFPGAEGKA